MNLAMKTVLEEARANAQSALTESGLKEADADLDMLLFEFSAVGPMDHYRHIPAPAQTRSAAIASELDDKAERHLLRAALAHGVAQLLANERLQEVPDRIAGHHFKQLQRIASSTAQDATWFDWGSDLYLKDLGLVTLRLLAAAAQLLDVRCGIPRSRVYKEGLGKAPGNLLRFLRLGGFKPYVQIHTHLSYLDEFNEEGWNECYRCCVDLYEATPQLLGMFGSSWFYDPALAEISPRLAYLRDVPVNGGATLTFVESGGSAIANATATSSSRRALYDAKKYMPASYMMAWGKQAQTEWAADAQGRSATP